MISNLKCVVARFSRPNGSGINGLESGDYAYFIPEGDNPQPGDVLLTSTSWDTYGEISTDANLRSVVMEAKLARVVEVVAEHPKATKFYMQLLPLQGLKDRHQANRELIAKKKAQADARKQLDEMMQTRTALAMYEALAKTNPEAARLLAVLKGEETDDEAVGRIVDKLPRKTRAKR